MKNNTQLRSLKKAVLFICFIFLLMNFEIIPAMANEPEKNILIINSYYSGYDWTDGQFQGILNTINKYENVVEYAEYMDWKRNPTSENLNNFYNYCKNKYSEKKIDLIITTDDAALNFAIKYRNELFSNAPIVFGGVEEKTANSDLAGIANVTGVYEDIDPKGTIEEALKILPKTKDVYIVRDNTETGLSYYNMVKGFKSNNDMDINIHDLGNYSVDEICEITKELNDDSIVLIDAYSAEYNGFSISLKRLSNMITESSVVPVFTTSEALVGDGCIGGSVLSSNVHGTDIGMLALKILNGENVNTIPFVDKKSIKPMYDHNILKKYNLLSSVLPENSIIVNKPFSFYETYKIEIYITLSIFIILIILIVYLISNIKKRIKAERILLDNNEEINALYEEILASEESLQLNYIELNKKQDQLAQSEEKYRLVAEASSDIIWEEDVVNNSRIFSDKLYEILGYYGNELRTFDDWYNIIHPVDKDLVRDMHLGLSNRGGKNDNIEYRIKCKNGEYKWIVSNSKPQYDESGHTIKIYGSYKDITELKENQLEIRNLAFYDSITNLPNRVSLHNTLVENIKNGKRFTIFFVDLDNFKIINDSYGHAVGDKLLILVSKRINYVGKEEFTLFRLGGDEFIVIYNGVNDKEIIENIANEILLEILKPYKIEDNFFHISASLGIASYPESGRDIDELLKNADIAMYKSKESGKNKFTFFDIIMGEENIKIIKLHNSIFNAIKNEEFILYYQPITDVNSGHIVGMEALIRWLNPKEGLIMPDKFIQAAEESGKIIEIGKFVIRSACRFIKELINNGYKNIYVSVNVSAVQLIQNDFKDTLFDIIEETKIAPEYLVLEITETVFIESFEEMAKLLSEIRKIGVRIALDDFGCGYSSLTYLKQLPMDLIKIDKSFIDDILNVDENKCIVGLIISLMKQFDFKVIAEGIETKKQLEYIREYKCDYFQGYLVSKPIKKEEILELLIKK